MKDKCIVMFSGGLDSRLAIKIMQERGIDVLALFFKLPFSKDVEGEIRKFVKEQKANLIVLDCTTGELFKEYLLMIRKPKYQRGSCLNPCVDCKVFMLEKAKEIADKKGIQWVVTGEVEGQRPMSQMKKSLGVIEEESGLRERILRPVDEIAFGRRRDKQIALAKKFKINYPPPAGGCLLCEKLYCEKLRRVLCRDDLSNKDIKLLKIGRHFEASNIILGRDKKENELLEKEKGIKIIPMQPGATALVKTKKYEEKAKKLIKKYSKHDIEGFDITE
ncbi:MAG: 7-cyano-7-deazaguanine synthase [archaeon]